MDKSISATHLLSLNDRKNINITGVKKIENFDDKEFLLETNMGFMIIKGSDLELIKLDTYQGDVSIKGKIDSIVYQDSKNKKKDESVFEKLFK